MKHDTVPLFSQPVTKVDINIDGIAEFFDEVVKPTQGEINRNRTQQEESLIHYHNDDNVFNIYSELNELRDSILEASNFAYQRVMNYDGKLNITNAWFNLCDVGGSQFMHNHCNSVISGTLYLRTDINTNIQFLTPFRSGETSNSLVDRPNLSRENEYGYSFHYDMCTITVGNGTCLFWPSYLKHGYINNQTPNRLSLSFNFMVESFNNTYNPFFMS